jgi:hypothetical protein
MRYIFVRWLHEYAEEPLHLYSELDDDRYETRKVEIFRGGRVGLAGPNVRRGWSNLGDKAIPELEEIASSEFVPQEISRDEFEAIWQIALQFTDGAA